MFLSSNEQLLILISCHVFLFFYIYIFIIFSVLCFVDSVDFKKGKSVLLLNSLKMIIQQQNQSMLLLLLFKGHTIKEANVETSALGTTEGRKL